MGRSGGYITDLRHVDLQASVFLKGSELSARITYPIYDSILIGIHLPI